MENKPNGTPYNICIFFNILYIANRISLLALSVKITFIVYMQHIRLSNFQSKIIMPVSKESKLIVCLTDAERYRHVYNSKQLLENPNQMFIRIQSKSLANCYCSFCTEFRNTNNEIHLSEWGMTKWNFDIFYI